MRDDFWPGFAAGAAVGGLAGLGVLLRRRLSRSESRILRLEKSINIGRPVNEVFAAWSRLEELPRSIPFIKKVEKSRRRWMWLVEIEGRRIKWFARITQVVPNESMAWKSLRGPRHTGRITFSPLEDQTVVHLVMNYVPRVRRSGSLLSASQNLEHWVGRGLREFKAALEKDVREHGKLPSRLDMRRSGSAGDIGERAGLREEKRRAGIK